LHYCLKAASAPEGHPLACIKMIQRTLSELLDLPLARGYEAKLLAWKEKNEKLNLFQVTREVAEEHKTFMEQIQESRVFEITNEAEKKFKGDLEASFNSASQQMKKGDLTSIQKLCEDGYPNAFRQLVTYYLNKKDFPSARVWGEKAKKLIYLDTRWMAYWYPTAGQQSEKTNSPKPHPEQPELEYLKGISEMVNNKEKEEIENQQFWVRVGVVGAVVGATIAVVYLTRRED